MTRKTRVRRHKRRKPTGGYTIVKAHDRQLSLDRFSKAEKAIKKDLKRPDIKNEKTEFGTDKELYQVLLDETNKTGDEKGYLIDNQGKVIKIEGTGRTIDPWEVRKANEKLGDRITFIHSHPKGMGEYSLFSPSDIALFIGTSKHRTLGMIDSSGMIYELKKPNNNNDTPVFTYSFDDITKAKKRFKYYIRGGQNREDLTDLALIDYVLENFSDKYNLEYKRERLEDG